MLLKLSIHTSSAAEEAVAHLLEDLAGQPASIYVDARTESTVATVYLPKASDWSARTRQALRFGLQRIKSSGLDLGSGRVVLKRIQPEDWAESWKRHFKPIEIGRALLLKPSWSKRKPRKNQAVMVLDPGLSFGTGQHPTTRFCLEQIVGLRDPARAQSFLDIGTGSGILGIAAAKLGYQPVVGFDIDPEAIRVARANAGQNQVQKKVQLICRDLLQAPLSDGRWDLICANLIFDLLLEGKNRILRSLKPGGTLVLAGILRSQFPEVRAAYEDGGLKLRSRKMEKEWASAAFISPD